MRWLLLLLVLGGLAACGQEGGDVVTAQSNRDGVFTIRNNQRDLLAASDSARLQEGEGVDVDETGRAILQFSDLLTVEVLRDGELTIQQLSLEEQSPLVQVLQNGGALLSDFQGDAAIAHRFTVDSDFAIITATGTRFVVVKEKGSPLEWVIGLDAAGNELMVTSKATDGNKSVVSGQARWVAPLGDPGPEIQYDAAGLDQWLAGVRAGQPGPEIGEVIWPHADVRTDTEPLSALPAPGENFSLAGVGLQLDPTGYGGAPSYNLMDCNGDGVQDIAMKNGRLLMDFRLVAARVRTLDVTVWNEAEPNSGALHVYDPARTELAQRPLDAPPSRVAVVSLLSREQPYHYAALEMRAGCFLGFSLTPPPADDQPYEPRVAVTDAVAPPAATPAPTETLAPAATPLPTLTPAPKLDVAVSARLPKTIEGNSYLDLAAVTLVARNVGNVPVYGISGDIFFSPDATLDSNDLLLAVGYYKGRLQPGLQSEIALEPVNALPSDSYEGGYLFAALYPDPVGELNDDDPINNVFPSVVTVSALSADLGVESIDDVQVRCVEQGCSTNVTFTIINAGPATSELFTVLVENDALQGNTRGKMAAGERQQFSVSLPDGGNCYNPDCTVCVTISPLTPPTDPNESNNQLCTTLLG